MTTDQNAPQPQPLGTLLARWSELEVGVEYPVSGNFCRYCGGAALVFLLKLEAVEGSLAGAQPKVSAKSWPYLRCLNCGHESRGNPS